MKQQFITCLTTVLFLFVLSTSAIAQASGDLVFTNGSGDGKWNTIANWSVSNGAGGYTGVSSTLPTTSYNVWIPASQTVLITSATPSTGGSGKVYAKDLHVSGTLNCRATTSDYASENSNFLGNIYVESTGAVNDAMKWIVGNGSSTGDRFINVASGGKLYFQGTSRLFICGTSGSVTLNNEGAFGAATWAVNTGALITMGGSFNGNVTFTMTGNGSYVINKLASDNYAPNSRMVVDANITLTANSGAAVILIKNSNLSNTSHRYVTVNSGKTLTLTSGSWFNYNATSTSRDANNTYLINGTLDCSAASIYFGSPNNSQADSTGINNRLEIKIGSTGLLKCGSTIKVEKFYATQNLNVIVAEGGKITYPAGSYATFPQTATIATGTTGVLLTNANSDITFTGSASTNLALNNDFSGRNIVLPGALNLTGASNFTVNGTLTMGGKITGNTGSFILGSNAQMSGNSTTKYIDLASGGSLVRKSVSAASTLFPVGYGSFYTPLTLNNTSNTPDITTKVSPTFSNAVEDASKVVNLQWSVVASIPAISDISYQFNGGNTAASFNVNSSCELGNYTGEWSSVNVGTPDGTDPYSVTATGLSIPVSNNLYILGNCGSVVRTSATNTIWSGAVSNDWNTAGNWSNGIPNSTLDVEIPASLAEYPVISVTDTIKNLLVANGAMITNNGALKIAGQIISVQGTLAGDGNYILNGSDIQTITGNFTVNNLMLNNTLGFVNNGVLAVNNSLNIAAGAITGTAPVFAVNLPVIFTGTATSSSGVGLTPSAGNIGQLEINGQGSLVLSAATTVKTLLLTAGTLNNSSYNIAVTDSITRFAAVLSAAPVYAGSIPVNYKGTNPVSSGFELNPASGSISRLTLSGTNSYTVGSAVTIAGDLLVQSGTMTMNANVNVQNVTIAEGAMINSGNNSGSSTGKSCLILGNAIPGGDATLKVNGLLGGRTRWTADGIDIQVSANAKKVIIDGSNSTGYVGVSGLRPVADANSRALDIEINRSMHFGRDQGGSGNIEPAVTLQNGTCAYARTLTIAAGDTLYIRGNAGLHGLKNAPSKDDELINNYASSTSNQGNCTYIVKGVLDLVSEGYAIPSSLNLNTCSFSGNTQSVILNVKSGGVVRLPGIVKMFTSQNGQTSDIVTEKGSKVIFGFNGNQYNLLTGVGNIPAFNFNDVEINNTNGITLSRPMYVKGILTQTAGNITGSSVIMNGSENQTIVSNGNSIENLTINNSTGVTGAPVVSNTLTLTNGTISDFSNLSNATVVFNGSSVQTIGAGLSAVKNLTINNAAGVSLGSDPTVTGVLSIINGRLSLENHNLIIGTTGSISLASNSNYLVTNGSGLLVMNALAATSNFFPVGTASSFNPVTMNPTSSAMFYVGVKNEVYPALPLTDTTILPMNTLNRTWNITTSNPSSTTLTFGYNGTTDNNSGFDNTGVPVSLLQNNGAGWNYVGSGSVTPGIGVSTAKTATIEGIGSFSSFTIANPGPGAVYTNTSGSSFSDIFRSTGDGNWGSSSLWELWDATTSAWSTTALSPTETSTVTIQSGHTVTLTTTAGVGNLTIESGAVLKSSVSANTSIPVVLTIGKASSVIRNNGLFGCAIGSVAGTLGDGITLALGANCVSFQLTGTGESGIGNLYALAGSNNLSVLINQNIQFRYTSVASKKTALSLVDPNGNMFTGSRNLIVSAGKTISFINSNSCLHGTAFSSTGSYTEQQGNIYYDLQGTLDLKGGNVYVTSSSNTSSAAQIVKINVGANGSIIAAGDFNFAKVQKTQTVYINIEDGGLIDASAAPVTKSNFYGPSITSLGDSLYVWIITNGNSLYKRLCGTGSTTKYFNVAVAPQDGDLVNIKGNPLAVSTNGGTFTDVYSVNVNPGHPYPITSFDPAYALNRTWTIIPSRFENPYGTYIDFGFTGTSVTDANSVFSPTLGAISGSSRYNVNTEETSTPTSVPAGSTDLYTYIGETGYWYCLFPVSYNIPVAGGTLGSKYKLRYNSMYSSIGNFVAPYKFTLRNTAASLICK